jgi:hypothetical protein
MKSKSMPIFDLLNTPKKGFMIPEVQRDYTWDKESVKRLLDDLRGYSDNTDKEVTPHYFVGSLILYRIESQPNVLQIMDGQQRITSFTVLYAALRARLQKLIQSGLLSDEDCANVEKWRDTIDAGVLWLSFDPDVMNLQPKDEETKKFLKEVVDFGTKDPANHSVKFKSVSAKNLVIAFDVFWNDIKSWTHKEVIDFLKCLEKRVVVSVTYTQDISVAFQMFVSVNKGGTPLNDYDLFRGLIMTKAHTLGLDEQLKPDVRQMSAQILTCMGNRTGNKSETLHNDLMRKWVSARYGLSVTSRDVASRLDKDIRGMTELGDLKEIVTQAYSFFKAYAQISDGAEMGRIASVGAGWLPGVLQSRRIQGFAGGDFIKLQHSIVLIAMYARQYQGQKPYSAKDVNDVMDYIEWLEFRLSGDGDSSRTLYSVYSKMASRAFGASKTSTWWDDLDSTFKDVVNNSSSVGFSFLKEKRIDRYEATALLSKVKNSTKDPGRGGFQSYGCNAVQLLPYSSPDPWSLSNDKESRFSYTIGNWFLIQVSNNEMNGLAIAPTSRLNRIYEVAETDATRKELEVIVDNKAAKGGNSKAIEEHWTKKSIISRTNQIIRELNEAYPRTFKKK